MQQRPNRIWINLQTFGYLAGIPTPPDIAGKTPRPVTWAVPPTIGAVFAPILSLVPAAADRAANPEDFASPAIPLLDGQTIDIAFCRQSNARAVAILCKNAPQCSTGLEFPIRIAERNVSCTQSAASSRLPTRRYTVVQIAGLCSRTTSCQSITYNTFPRK